MKFEDAINAHASWKHRLVNLIAGASQEKLDPAVVGRHDLCDLGKWLHEMTGTPLAADATFKKLVEAHAHFHEATSTIIRRVQRGEKLDYKAELFQGRFADLSTEVVGHLLTLRRLYETHTPGAPNGAASPPRGTGAH